MNINVQNDPILLFLKATLDTMVSWQLDVDFSFVRETFFSQQIFEISSWVSKRLVMCDF